MIAKTIYPMRATILLLLLLIACRVSAQNCKSIEREMDKFNGSITLRTPVLDKVAFTKVQRGDVEVCYLALRVDDNTLIDNLRGVTVLFEDGSKMEKPGDKIDVEPNEYKASSNLRYTYSAFVELQEEDIAILRAKRVTDFRLYVFDAELTKAEQDEALTNFNCLLKSK